MPDGEFKRLIIYIGIQEFQRFGLYLDTLQDLSLEEKLETPVLLSYFPQHVHVKCKSTQVTAKLYSAKPLMPNLQIAVPSTPVS